MTALDPMRDPSSALVEAAHAFHRAAETRASHTAAPESLESLQETLQVLSAAWYRLAADAAATSLHRTGASQHTRELTREQEVRLIGAFHDVAAAFARCARASRDGRSTIAPIIARSVHTERRAAAHRDGQLSWFAGSRAREMPALSSTSRRGEPEPQ
jgi:hypothetical protein